MAGFYRVKTQAERRKTARKEGRVAEHDHYLHSREKRWQRKQLIRQHGGRCTRCHEPVVLGPEGDPRYAVVHHLLPLSEGGTDRLSNLTLYCLACSGKQSAEHLPEAASPDPS